MYFITPKVNRTNYSNVLCGFIRSETIKKFSPILFNTNIKKGCELPRIYTTFWQKSFYFKVEAIYLMSSSPDYLVLLLNTWMLFV